MLAVGVKAPDFEYKTKDGQVKKLSDLLGKKVVVYFYPKDMTPGCTKQACSFTDHYEAYLAKGMEVIGISKDSEKSHDKFREKYQLSFPLVADENLEVIKAYDVWQEKNMYGKKVMGVVRSTFIIDEKGMIEKVYEKANSSTNAEDVLKYIEEV